MSGLAEPIKYNVHTYLQGFSIEHNQTHATKSSFGYAVLIYNLKGDKNTGTIIRTSVAMGASKIFIIGDRQYDQRTVVGAKHYIDIERIKGIPDPRDLLKGFSPICVEQGGVASNKVEWSRRSSLPPCFIMGSEDIGIPPEFIAKCAEMPGFLRVSIFQYGVIRSLNVATAHSILLHEYMQTFRKRIEGIYGLF